MPGRSFEMTARAGLGDCAPGGRMRLDAIARWLQDVAYADVDDAGLATQAVWVVRRTRIEVQRFPRFGERCRLVTWCSGIGRMWAERRTTLLPADRAPGQPQVEAVALWVHLDPTGRPAPFSAAEMAVYGESAGDRRISARLHHPRPPAAPHAGWPWTFRATECDVADHVNNAAYWSVLEERLLTRGTDPDDLCAEIEFRTPAQPGDKLVIDAGPRLWIADAAGEIHASVLVHGN